MTSYIEQWFDVLENMKNTNTYKLAWGKSILDYAKENTNHEIPIKYLAERVLKYYWNQMYFFKLKQGPLNQTPTLYQIVEKTITAYQQIAQSKQPIWFNKALIELLKDTSSYNKRINAIVRVLYQDVAKRFPITKEKTHNLYTIDKNRHVVIIEKENFDSLRVYGRFIMPFLYLKWAQLLEKFNHSPRIANKIAGSGQQSIQRKSLATYRKILLKLHEGSEIRDFYTNEVLSPEDVSVDHFIPWSYLYSDDIWNLVLTSRSQNSKKSNQLTSKEFLDRLIQQNKKLLKLINDPSTKNILHEAIEHHYLEKFYQDFSLG
jgi:5-methylcytosine-specific restriction endonuclease McrA